VSRPLYDDYGHAYDTLFDDPVEPWVEVVREVAPPPGDLLDAGCGTGRHALALRDAGYAVTLVDGAAALLGQARARLPGAPAHLADLRTLDLGRVFDAITCRGVLNDVVGDDDRQAVLDRFAAHLRPGGALVLDVRELEATRERYAGGRTLRREGFESDGAMDGDLLRVVERFGGTVSEATIRPWSRVEVEHRLAAAGFAGARLAVSPGRPDRLLAVASR
jgi:glycine/sarcosine N-methyltransferase